jgi:hypothetical protein
MQTCTHAHHDAPTRAQPRLGRQSPMRPPAPNAALLRETPTQPSIVKCMLSSVEGLLPSSVGLGAYHPDRAPLAAKRQTRLEDQGVMSGGGLALHPIISLTRAARCILRPPSPVPHHTHSVAPSRKSFRSASYRKRRCRLSRVTYQVPNFWGPRCCLLLTGSERNSYLSLPLSPGSHIWPPPGPSGGGGCAMLGCVVCRGINGGIPPRLISCATKPERRSPRRLSKHKILVCR